LSQQFEKTAPNGSRRAVVGGTIGGALGSFVGGPAGAGIGSLGGAGLDRYGGQLAGKLIDSYLKAGNSAAFGKFGPAIQKASERTSSFGCNYYFT
jgi:hypothetical protein